MFTSLLEHPHLTLSEQRPRTFKLSLCYHNKIIERCRTRSTNDPPQQKLPHLQHASRTPKPKYNFSLTLLDTTIVGGIFLCLSDQENCSKVRRILLGNATVNFFSISLLFVIKENVWPPLLQFIVKFASRNSSAQSSRKKWRY